MYMCMCMCVYIYIYIPCVGELHLSYRIVSYRLDTTRPMPLPSQTSYGVATQADSYV